MEAATRSVQNLLAPWLASQNCLPFEHASDLMTAMSRQRVQQAGMKELQLCMGDVVKMLWATVLMLPADFLSLVQLLAMHDHLTTGRQ